MNKFLRVHTIAKNLAPVAVTAVAMMFPTQETDMRQIICKDLSPVFPAVQVTSNEVRKVANHTGAVSNKVSMLPYPSVSTILGKKY